MLTGTIKFIIYVNDVGEVEVRNGSNEEFSSENRGSLIGNSSEAASAMPLSGASELVMFDSLAIMGFGQDRVLSRVCVKRANCLWYCS